MDVYAAGSWSTNAEMIADVTRLGYLDGTVLDSTFGMGKFWTKRQPQHLLKADLYRLTYQPTNPPAYQWDFTALPLRNECVDSVVFDPPFKLSGTPSLGEFDVRYGIERTVRWQDKVTTILDGATECARVARKFLLVKTQDQVCSGKVRWLTDDITQTVGGLGFRKRDRFDLISPPRPQPLGRTQKHARRNMSTLLVFERNT
jgi:hypothetical protein